MFKHLLSFCTAASSDCCWLCKSVLRKHSQFYHRDLPHATGLPHLSFILNILLHMSCFPETQQMPLTCNESIIPISAQSNQVLLTVVNRHIVGHFIANSWLRPDNMWAYFFLFNQKPEKKVVWNSLYSIPIKRYYFNIIQQIFTDLLQDTHTYIQIIKLSVMHKIIAFEKLRK